MDDELDLDLGDDKSKEIISRKDKKIDSLSEKLGNTEKEKALLAEEKQKETLARQTAEKERDFLKGFGKVSTKYPGASEFQDKILEKVNLGYDVEDATISILAKEGKYTPSTQPLVRESAAGGSAATGIADPAEKKPEQMSRAELRSQLLDLESKGEFKL